LGLKIAYIDPDRTPAWVAHSKGKKDRYAKLSVKFLVLMDESKLFSKALPISQSDY
jgi:hypothetical protein